ncbi:MAG TPA: hypothetical protein V6C76_03225 [Drouetiella sp.]
MRLVVSLLFFCLALVVAGFVYTVLTNPAKTYSFFANLGNPESLEKRALTPFAPPKSAYKISFPTASKPDELSELMQYTRQSPLPCPQYFVADKEVAYYATSYPTPMDTVTPMSNGRKNYAVVASSVVNGNIPTVGENSAIIYDPTTVQNFLESKCEGILSKCHATATLKAPVSVGGGRYPGRIIEGQFTDTGNAFRMKFYLDQQNKRIYAVAVVGDKKRVFSAQANKFLNSMEIWS